MTHFRPDSQSVDEPPSRKIVNLVAICKNTEPLELPPLYDSIDPEALNALFSSNGFARHGTVSFVYGGCEVTVENSGHVRVRDVDEGHVVDSTMEEKVTSRS